jgi:predicted Zn-dependent peptidase
MGYTFDALKTYVPQMVELLIDCVRNPAFLDWEVNEEVFIFYYSLLSWSGPLILRF